MTEKFDGIIFDVDGTLWDSTGIAAASYNKVLAKEGSKRIVTGDELKQLFGKPMDEIFAALYPEIPAERAAKLAEDCMALENEDLKVTPGEWYPHLRETFIKLAERYPLFIVSNCQCGYIELVIEEAELSDYIRDHLCFGETGTSKGQTLLTLMKRNGLSNPVYVGDTQGDADACAEAGIPIIYCTFGFGKIHDPYASINDLAELTEIL